MKPEPVLIDLKKLRDLALFSENVEQLIRSEIKEYVLAVSPKPTSP